ncbi:MAG: GNAT family N-acetyltransferase [Leptospirales bacterium]
MGRFAVHTELASKGIGSKLINFIKLWFTVTNKTGCRFLIVDARNSDPVIKFYRKNGFEDYPETSRDSNTVLMFYDLLAFQLAFDK